MHLCTRRGRASFLFAATRVRAIVAQSTGRRLRELPYDLPMTDGTFEYDGATVPVIAGDSILLALQRSGTHPTGGGTLCFDGDCPNCLCTVDGVSYVRSCQVPAEVGVSVWSHPTDAAPPLPGWNEPSTEVAAEHRSADVVVVGAGESGTRAADVAHRAGRTVEVLDARAGAEVVAVYPGPLVLARTARGMVEVECAEVVVATGAAEIQPVVPGSELAGLYTSRAAKGLIDAGVDLTGLVGVGDLAADLSITLVPGELVRFEGEGSVSAVVTRTEDGEIRTPCAAVALGLGLHPRTGLSRMADHVDVHIVGDAALEPTIPACPSTGVVCPCSEVTVGQLDDVHERGFTHMELLKRSTLAGTGTCQGAVCTPYLRSFLLARGHDLSPPFTARPVTRQLTLDEMAAGSHLPVLARTALDDVHRQLGARMDRMGGWWRPWTYGDTDAEYRAVRERVSLGDVSTLGKMIVAGPDAEATLQRIFPTDVATIRPGRSRYVLMLDERGYVMDDGMVAREHDDTFFLTFTSGGASMAEMWIRDWADSWGHDIRLLNQTFSLGAINVTGPRAAELLEKATVDPLPPFLGHSLVEVAGVPCKAFRLSFTGELSYELHHPADRSGELWSALMSLGAEYDIAPHGIEALFRLRLEKGHIIVGQDTDYGASPRRLQHEWAVNMQKGDFIGRAALERTDRIPLDRKLVGFESERALYDGAVLWAGDHFAGTISSSAWSPTTGTGVALGWLESIDGRFPETVIVDGIEAHVVEPHFYDPQGRRARV